MKKTILVLALAMVSAFAGFAQGVVKIGYTDVNYVLSLMPEAKQIDQQLKEHEKQLANQVQAKMQEFQAKVAQFQQEAPNMIPEVRADKEKELQGLQVSIQEFQQNAQVSLQKKQLELLQPVYDKIQNAINTVAKDNGYTYVFSSNVEGLPVLLYAEDKDNISDLVLKNLGVTPPTE